MHTQRLTDGHSGVGTSRGVPNRWTMEHQMEGPSNLATLHSSCYSACWIEAESTSPGFLWQQSHHHHCQVHQGRDAFEPLTGQRRDKANNTPGEHSELCISHPWARANTLHFLVYCFLSQLDVSLRWKDFNFLGVPQKSQSCTVSLYLKYFHKARIFLI